MSKSIAFVTGATGLLGNNLVRLLLERGWTVKALARSTEKAEKQFNGLEVQVVQGDMTNVEQFASELIGVNAVFHTAAYFRESFLGGSHWNELYVSNVLGTRRLLDAAYDAGVRKFVQTSSIAVLNGPRGAVIDESMSRPANDGDDYYTSKILADQEVSAFLSSHPDFFAVFVLPGWMHGPGDSGPTQAGQTTLDFVKRKLPGIPPGTVSVVDARDVGLAMIAALERGKRGERYLSAGRNMDMKGVFSELQEVTGIPAPRRKLPLFMLYFIAAIQELRARLTKAPALLSWATVRLMVRENGRSTFSDQKLREELGVQFRPVRETLRDEVEWYREHGWLNTASEASR